MTDTINFIYLTHEFVSQIERLSFMLQVRCRSALCVSHPAPWMLQAAAKDVSFSRQMVGGHERCLTVKVNWKPLCISCCWHFIGQSKPHRQTQHQRSEKVHISHSGKHCHIIWLRVWIITVFHWGEELGMIIWTVTASYLYNRKLSGNFLLLCSC